MSLIKTYYQKWRILNGLRILPSINEGTGEGWKQYRGTGSGSKRSRCRRNIRRCIYRDKKAQTTVDKLLKVIQNGDKVVVTKLDRIARSATQGIALIDMMLDKGVTVHILNMGIMDNTPTGRLIRTIMLAFAEFERDMIVERTQEGKAIAKQKDDFKEGRPRISKIKIDHALSLLDEGYSYKQVERMTGISTATLARRKRERLLEEDS